MTSILLLGVSTGIIFIASIALYFNSKSKLNKTNEELNHLKEIASPRVNLEKELSGINDKDEATKSTYRNLREKLTDCEALIEEHDIGVGTVDSKLYILPDYTDNTYSIEQEIKSVKDEAKKMVKDRTACICNIGDNITLGNSKAKARSAFKREEKLRIRCLDNEVKAAIVLVDWYNVQRLKERIKKTFHVINSSGHLTKTFLQEDYLKLKLAELQLSFDLTEQKQVIKEREREEKAIQTEAERDEQKLQAAQKKAETERLKMETLIEKELAKLTDKTGASQDKLNELKAELAKLKEREVRAMSMAQQTRAGYVYVISNPMAFGDRICKIGMTRRLEPSDRVKELSSASVPDVFTTHAFIYSEDAPSLERQLHNKFDNKRLNLVNLRKEYFEIDPNQAIDAASDIDSSLEIKRFA
ncbi:DUF4041 domain-containing protein [Moritella sp. Urea-trap-13]|uniref:DUF4041 domain-containing protein n=1 Tax=Moritella sp. Urea-trap-13 TaxID=2058327 RepID=UPI000C31FC69|nr:DUF4041 domain-containing protein [Moritella sp. Urea-trap-13]PKH05920.1 hypothetical protein CXF93_08235 [Moritella sp. Urea-trap-13]